MFLVRYFLFVFSVLPILLYGVGEVSISLRDPRVLRIATLHNLEMTLPRLELLQKKEWLYLEQFARDNHFRLKILYVRSQEEAFDLLKSEKADLYASQLIYSPSLDRALSYSLPLFKVDEYLISTSDKQVSIGGELAGKSLGIFKTPRQEKTAKKLQGSIDNLHIVNIPFGVNGDHLYRQLNEDIYDYIIMRGDQFVSDQLYRNDLKKSHQLTEDNAIVWAVNTNNKTLLERINFHLLKIKSDTGAVKVIRVGFVNHHDSYFLLHGEEKGFHYTLVDTFFRKHGLSYRIVIAENKYQLKTMLKEKKIDIAADFYREQDIDGCCMALSAPIFYFTPVFVTAHTKKAISVNMFSDRFLSVPSDSPYIGTLNRLLRHHPSLKALKVSSAIPVKTMLKRLQYGIYDLAIAEDYVVDRENQYQTKPYLTLPADDKIPVHWLVANEQSKLIDDIEHYLNEDHIARIYDQYFRFFSRKPASLKRKKALTSVYDELVIQFAENYQFDPKLLIAQMYQESQFDPSANSGKGGIGLFQIQKKPANFLGFYEIHLPKNNIHAAIVYMQWLRQQLRLLGVHKSSMNWFLLAAYHAGIDHVKDAIHLAYKKGWPTDRWFQGVEKAMKLLEEPRFYTYARFGYIRGTATIDYVNAIKATYEADKNKGGNVRQLLAKIVILTVWKKKQQNNDHSGEKD